ncbi:hypothetical protein OG500_18030 [Kitasatospora sp. NBC_01250]|uniref:hypothetical protein n=1 Tax=unclassified Kitasatospora TaxID=2633591 RepID=UPI002E133A60|nr:MULTISPECIES: hypothetical protein [unclassified Kitasatospora]WSJ68027.1 hypothetical protein OG294_18960 [Kitasatospora sp. NBC_01302]
MTWMPDRAAAPRGRRVNRSAQNPSYANAAPHQNDWAHGSEHPDTEPHPLGIPRILGRRARWVGARLRREA